MKFTHLFGTMAVVAAMTVFSAAPTFAKGGGHGGHAGGHTSHAGHSHAAAHHTATHSVAHHGASHNHSFAHHTGTGHNFAHNHYGYGHAWGHGYGHGWGYGGWGWGHRGYWGGWGPGYVTTGSGPSYYYSNPSYSYSGTVTDPVFPPVSATVTPNTSTEVIEQVAPIVPPQPVDGIQIGSVQSINDSTSVIPTSGPAPTSAI